MKKHGGITAFLNQNTQKGHLDTKIIYLDVNVLEKNEENFYGLREIESLAAMILTAKYIEPLVVKKIIGNGKYKIIAGHRRYAAICLLNERGELKDPQIPCIIKSFTEQGCLSADEIEKCTFIFSNRGQRQERTTEEKLEEIKQLEPIAKKVWKYEREQGRKGNFRSFFAEEVLNISPSALQRLLSLQKLTPEAKSVVDEGLITETAAAKLAALPEEDQEEYISNLKDGKATGTIKDIPCKNSEKLEEDSQSELKESECKIVQPHVSQKEDVQTESVDKKADTQEIQDENVFVKNASIPNSIDDAEAEADIWFLENLQSMMQYSIKMMAKEKEKGNEKASAQWDVRRSKVALVMAIVKEQK